MSSECKLQKCFDTFARKNSKNEIQKHTYKYCILYLHKLQKHLQIIRILSQEKTLGRKSVLLRPKKKKFQVTKILYYKLHKYFRKKELKTIKYKNIHISIIYIILT